jgi:SAM-dependent methyltransferase
MNSEHQGDSEQAALWNGVAGRAWVEAEDLLDHVLRPLERRLVEAVVAGSGSRVLDVGCGTGSTTVAVARVSSAKDGCVGIDISEPMITAARARAAREALPVRFIRADAQTYAFEPAGFDMIVSRFGVMFFDDPVRAFSNLRLAAADNAGLRFIVWRSAAENPFMTTAERAAAAVLPDIPQRPTDGPGPFALADQQRVSRMLKESGWDDIDLQPIDAFCTLPEKDLIGYFTRLGPLGRIFNELDEQLRAQVIETVRPAFDRYVHGEEVRFTAACWMIAARRG